MLHVNEDAEPARAIKNGHRARGVRARLTVKPQDPTARIYQDAVEGHGRPGLEEGDLITTIEDNSGHSDWTTRNGREIGSTPRSVQDFEADLLKGDGHDRSRPISDTTTAQSLKEQSEDTLSFTE